MKTSIVDFEVEWLCRLISSQVLQVRYELKIYIMPNNFVYVYVLATFSMLHRFVRASDEQFYDSSSKSSIFWLI